MVNKKTIRGIAFVVLMLSIVIFSVEALTLSSPSPPGAVSDTVGASRPFSITALEPANFTWYVNGTVVKSTETNTTSASYTNNSAALGYWNVTVIGVSVNDSSINSNTWLWTVTSAVQGAIHIDPSFQPSSSNPMSYLGANQEFNVTANQTGDFTWFIEGSQAQTPNSSVPAGTLVSYSNSSAGIGTYNVTVIASNTTGIDSHTWTWTVTTSPGNPVSGLTVVGRGATWINWTWTNPGGNFNYTMVTINTSFQTNTTDNFYNYTSFGVGTPNTISLQTVDTSGNVNSTVVSNQASTLNTQVGSNVIVSISGTNVTFSQVNGDGNTSVIISSTNLWGGPISFTQVGNYYNISLTPAVSVGNIIIEVSYDPTRTSNESAVRLYHWNGVSWDDVTTNVDIVNNKVRGNVTSLSPFVPGVPPAPAIIKDNPLGTNVETTGTQSVTFQAHSNQIANITWYLDNALIFPNGSMAAGQVSNYTPPSSIGQHNVTVFAANTTTGLSNSTSWNWTAHPKTYAAGNRVWDGGRPDLFGLTYTWNPMSFPGFYYDVNSDVGNESLTMTMSGYTDRRIRAGNILYDTTPEEVQFGYTAFGTYQVIGFMADKYFAGYIANTTIVNAQPSTTFTGKSALAQGQLHKVLMDDDTKRTISVGGTLTLQEGYVLKAVDIDLSARTMLVELLKDGNVVDSGTPLNAGQTYVYAPSRVGVVSDLPIIMIRFDSVFSGTEVQAAFLKGVFQISSNPTSVKTGDVYNDMKVTSVAQDKIEMSNNNDVNLARGNTENLMGNMNILVADNDTFRFALSTQQTGTFEVRSTVYRDSDPSPIDTWNPYNFGMNIGTTSVGFYYDLDSGMGNESLRLVTPLNGSRTLSATNLDYTTTPQDVSFGYSGFGGYQVIGFMADKYFAGYTINTTIANAQPSTTFTGKSALAQGQLHKVLIDDDTKRTISVGGTMTLQEGYVLKAVDIDLSARTMLVELLKDGNVVDPGTPLNAGQTYVYAPSRVGVVSDLPIIMIRFDSVFSGTEVQAAFLRGVFQISSNPTTVKTGDVYNDMTVTTVGGNIIEMNNKNAISLDNGKIEQLMGDINLKVGDTAATDGRLRFYFAVDVTPEMVANQLVIDAPAKATAGDVLNVKVTAGGNPQNGVSVAINSVDAGQTDSNGLVNYTLPRTLKGIYNITATKLGFQQATKGIEVLQYIDLRLSIDAPATANQFSPVNIRITYNGSAISGATVGYDNATIGTTDSNGILNYTLQTSGTHIISAAKSGYIAAVRDINVKAPFSQYQALNINITPGTVSVNEPALIRSNITNVGTKADTLPVELISNGTVVDNTTVSLAPGEIKEISFTRKEALPGNYTIEIMGHKGLLVVKEQPLNLPLIAVGATVIGLVAIYLLTAKGLLGNLLGKFKGIGGIKK
ncbi:MAG: S-layer protein domain-containing protein [Candidatus Methanoperedens sp.]|nr:S-layer protein domain-containing protein [Candidatus Methanoperedens sp.]